MLIGKAIGEAWYLEFKYLCQMKQPLVIALTILSLTVNAQEVKEFFDREGHKTDSASSYYYRIGIKEGSWITHRGITLSYYTATSVLKEEANYDNDGFRSGDYKEYYENGSIKKTGTYYKYLTIGDETTYYPNGKKQWLIAYPETPKSISKYRNIDFEIKDYWDSLGNQLVTSGEGICKCYGYEFPNDKYFIKEEGKVTGKVRDGKWSGFKQDTLRYEEYFSKGNFINGVSYKNGMQVHYTDIEKAASYPGGVNEMLMFINQKIIFPKSARRLGIDGKVFVEFIVNKDGSISDIKVIKGVYGQLDEEAMRIVRIMPLWEPGFHRGIAVRSKFVLPVTFKLER
jgi:TonB family protein